MAYHAGASSNLGSVGASYAEQQQQQQGGGQQGMQLGGVQQADMAAEALAWTAQRQDGGWQDGGLQDGGWHDGG